MHLSGSLILVFVVLLLLTRFWHTLNARLAASAAGFDEALSELRSFPAVLDRRLQQRRPLDLRQLLEQMPSDCESLLRGSGIALDLGPGAEPLPVLARKDELTQLLAHVAIIAVHAMPRGGVLSVRPAAERQQALLEFCDSGMAGSEPLLVALYLHGAQGGPAAGQAIDGARSALAASVASCRRIVAAHEGRIDAGPAASGVAALTIRLPLHLPAAAGAAPAAAG